MEEECQVVTHVGVWGFRVPGVQIPEASRKEWDSPYRKMAGRISPLSPVM